MLSGQNVIITGSNRGIGRAIVEKFAENGANIFACARKKSESFEKEMIELSEKYNVEIMPIYFDLDRKEEMFEAAKKIRATKKRIDILVNNAGILSDYQRFSMIPIDNAKKILDINFWAQMEFTQLIVRIMQRAKSGSIVFVSSIASIDGFFSSFDYAASKAAINISVLQLARELGEYNIRVNAVAPGVIETEMINDVDASSKQSLLPAVFLKRFGKAEDVANAIMFVASDMASYITGQIIRVDGGITPPKATW